MTSNRHQILQHLLENRNGMHIDELSNLLNISRTAVQNHFTILEMQGLIKKHSHFKTLGRPSIKYVLTDNGIGYFPKRYAYFTEVLLLEIKNDMGSDRLATYLQKMGITMADRYRSRFEGLSEDESINTLLKLFQELGFYPILHQGLGKSMIELTAHNCIYHDLAQKFQEICILDQTLIQELLGKQVELRSCMVKGENACCFRMSLGTD
jgi:DeoR family transcriptional regulator, suf operon transcriptional repressor